MGRDNQFITRIEYIDIAKGFAIICVVIGHVLCYDLYGFEMAWTSSSLMKWICTFHMPLFIFLSGLVSTTYINIKQIPTDSFKKIRQLLIPFFVIASIYSLSLHKGLNWIFDCYKYGYWYLWVIFIYHILNYFLISKRSQNVIVKYIILICIWYAISQTYTKIPTNIQNVLSLPLIINYYPYFILGNIIKRYNFHNIIFKSNGIFLICITIFFFKEYLHFSYSNYIISIAGIISIIYICTIVEKYKGKLYRSLNYIGQHTLYIYLFHYFIIQQFKTNFLHNFLINYSTFGIDLLLAVIPSMLCIVLSLLIYKVIENNTIIMKSIFYK